MSNTPLQKIINQLNSSNSTTGVNLILGMEGTKKEHFSVELIKDHIDKRQGLFILDTDNLLVDQVSEILTPEQREKMVFVDYGSSDNEYGYNIFAYTKDVLQVFTYFTDYLIHAYPQYKDRSVQLHLEHILHTAIQDLILSQDASPYTLLQYLSDEQYRNSHYPNNQLNQLKEKVGLDTFNEAVDVLLAFLGKFIKQENLKRLISVQKHIDLTDALETNKIVLVKLGKNIYGPEGATFIGTAILTGLYNAAMQKTGNRLQTDTPNETCAIYIDEASILFGNTLINLISEARPLKLELNLICSRLDQQYPESITAIQGNAKNIILFKTSKSVLESLRLSVKGISLEEVSNFSVNDGLLISNDYSSEEKSIHFSLE